MKIHTNADVRAEITRAGLHMQDVARQMGEHPSTFSRETRDLEGIPSRQWIAKFQDALDVLANGVAADR